LLGIAALAAVLFAWNLTSQGPAYFYPVAVKSMSLSWKGFFYGALDPGATITMDKIPGAFYLQALSARIFGFHAWSVALPQVIEGVVAVVVMYRVVRRWQGPVAGLLAAGLFALTPLLASMFGHPMEDSLLIMCLVLAADAFGLALTQSRLRPLVLAGVWVGIGFQAKMLEAWMVVPAFALTYLFVAPGTWRHRLGHVSVAGAVLLAVSMSWVLLVTVTPAKDRPYVDGSTNNSALAMVFGYNGLDRFSIHVPGAAQPVPIPTNGQGNSQQSNSGQGSSGSGYSSGQNYSGQGASSAGGAASKGGGAPQDRVKLFGATYGTQVGWLYPLALLGLALGLVRARRAPRTDPVRGGFIMWGLWALTFGAVYSSMALPHTAYVATLAPPIAALSAAGILLTWKGYRDGTMKWALPTAIAAETAWSASLWLRHHPTFLPWLIWLIVGVAVVAVAVLTAATATRRLGSAVLLGGMTAGIVTMVAAPAVWSASVLDPAYRGTAYDASAGPGSGKIPFIGPSGGPSSSTATTIVPLDEAEQRLDKYLTAHQGRATFVAASDTWMTAAPYIMATGQKFMPMGGFSGAIPYPTLAALRQLVDNGQLRYVFLSPADSFDAPFSLAQWLLHMTSTPASTITGWVKTSCTVILPSDYGDTVASGTLYRCGPSSS
jgi:4-amino-4-deoxy-L-arabinose transferase-like glycosyltransferase